ncbi:hypothetical protein GCM10027293_35140 [Pontibacter aydingkolensis]
MVWGGVAQAQQRTALDVQEWAEGKVVLVTGDTLYGALTYYRTPDIVNVHHADGSMSSVSPVNVEYFIAQEMPSGRSYTFRTLNWDLDKPYSNFKKPTFFEELNRGALTLVVRESYVQRDGNGQAASSFYSDNALSNNEIRFSGQIKEQYYVLLPNNELIRLRNLRKDLHTLFGDKSKDVKSYIKLNKLEYEKPHELIAIINYFNVITNATGHVF